MTDNIFWSNLRNEKFLGQNPEIQNHLIFEFEPLTHY